MVKSEADVEVRLQLKKLKHDFVASSKNETIKRFFFQYQFLNTFISHSLDMR